MVGTAADCTNSDGCKKFGACTPIQTDSVVQPLVCRAAGDDCTKADVCIHGRKCFAAGGVCTTEEQAPEACRVSPDCRNNGECSFQGGTCVATDEDCARERACPDSDNCVAVNGHCTTPGAK
jgi:hypothetical protein